MSEGKSAASARSLSGVEPWLGLALIAGIGTALVGSTATGQVVEREQDTTVTGPRGRTIQRDVRTIRGPGFVDRQVEIKRPGETLVRDTRVQTFPGPMGGGGFRSFGPPRFGPPPRFFGPPIVENVFVQRPAVVSGFVGLPSLSLFFGGGGGGGGGFFGGGAPAPPPPGPIAPGPGPANGGHTPPPFDPVTDAMGQLKSFHGNVRRDGALALGRMGDARAVPPLCDRLEHDFDKEVRVASAWALGEIGEERAAVALERAAIHDKRHEVRDAANLAVAKLPKPGQAPPAVAKPTPAPMPSPSPTAGQIPAQYPDLVPLQPQPQPQPRPQPRPTQRPVTSTPAPRPQPPEELDPGPGVPVVPPIPTPADVPPPPPVPASLPPLEPPSTTDPS